jgi:hypothetical protein
MTELLVVSLFSAFFIALFERFVHLGIMKIFVALAISTGGFFLWGGISIRHMVIYVGACCFLAPFLALIADKLSTFTKAIEVPLNPLGRNRF